MGSNPKTANLTEQEREVAENLKQQAVECQGRFFLLDKMLTHFDYALIEALKAKKVLISQGIFCGNFGFILFLYQSFIKKGFEPTHDGGTRYCIYYELVLP